MATIDYKQLSTPEANLIELLSAQNQDGTYSAKLMGSEPFSVLAAKTIYNTYNDIESNMAADVEGPASSTDNALARFDGTTGKLIQNSNAILTDAGALSLASNLTVSGGTITGGTSGLSLASGGTNQNITLTPSGIGALRANLATYATAFEITNNNNVTFKLNRTGVINPGSGGLNLISYGTLNAFADADLALSVNGATSSTSVFYAYGPGTTPVANTLVLRDGCTLLGTTFNSGNGKLQLATHTTSAGGIGFGSDFSLYRYSATGLKLTGTGSTSALYLTNNAAPAFGLQYTSANGYLWNEANGPIIFGTNNTTALTLDASQNATFAGQVLAGAGFVLGWNGRGHLIAPSNGIITLLNAASTDFTRLQFGGTTASFPALGRNGNALDCLLADSSGYANIRAERFVIASGTVQLISGTNSPEGVITANVGSLFLRTNGGASTTLYVKESGTGNTGWVAK